MDAVGYALASQIEPYQWRKLTPIPYSASFIKAEIVGSRVYLISMDRTQVFDITSNAWSQESPMPADRKRTHFATCAVGSKIYVLGGVPTTTGSIILGLRYVDIYDTVSKTWTKGPDLVVGVTDAGASYVDGKVYIFGGRNDFNNVCISDTYSLDIGTGVWSKKQNMPNLISEMGTTVYAGKIYVFGGFYRTSSSGSWTSYDLNSIYSFDPLQNQWASQGSIRAERAACEAVLLGKNIIVIGGKNQVVMAESYDPETKGKKILQSPTETFFFFGSVVYEGTVYVFDGTDVYTFNPNESSIDTLLAWLATR